MAQAHVRKGDTVVVIAGKERGKRGKVLHVFPAEGRVIVERLNMMKKHQKPTQKLRQGGIIEREAPLPPLQRDAAGSAQRQTHPGRHPAARGRQEGPDRQEVRRDHRQGVMSHG